MHNSARSLSLTLVLLGAFTLAPGGSVDRNAFQGHSIRVDPSRKTIRIENGQAGIRVNFNRRCCIDSLWIGARTVAGQGGGAYSGFRVGRLWYTTRSLLDDPRVIAGTDSLSIKDIRYSEGKSVVNESWTFAFDSDAVVWTIDRILPRAVSLDEDAFPAIGFRSIRDFDAALLGNGGVAWFRLFNDSAIAYGVHTDLLTFWKRGLDRCLNLLSGSDSGSPAVSLSRRGRSLTCSFSRSPARLRYRYDAGTHRRRFIRGKTDVWQTTEYPPGTYRQVLRISAPDYRHTLGRGTFRGIDGRAITSMLNTIARLGVIDSRLYGGNSWHTPYGPICLHEQYIAQFGIAIDDENYLSGYRHCLDYYRDHAIEPDGRVKARWAYTDEDAMPGSADSLGFYEAQWGILLDSNPDFVINVADLFDQCGDLSWLRTHKSSCENVLAFMLRRDSDRDSLAEMMTDSYTQRRGSDWLDVIWASWENAFVNAELYHALLRWSDLEDLMGDSVRARDYRAFAAGLKRSFNRSTEEGGFWQEKNGWYVHWREKDGSVYGNNLVTSVNFMAIAYGLCDEPARQKSILDGIERQMRKEKLFFWPSCMFPYEPGTGLELNFPFPAYENGDLFLSWGELGVRSYAATEPEIALRYVRNVIARYRKDGLAFQRYLRSDQKGAGDDILAGNASSVTGLYRDIYGIQPRYNRLYLNPHLTADLYGTVLRYRYRGDEYTLELRKAANTIGVGGVRFSSKGDCALKKEGPDVLWFAGNSAKPSLAVSAPGTYRLDVTVRDWSGSRLWSETRRAGTPAVIHRIMDLLPNREYTVSCDGRPLGVYGSDREGTVKFEYERYDGRKHMFEIQPRNDR
jgi:hypothetical protein